MAFAALLVLRAHRFEALPGVGDNRGGQVLSMSAITADKGAPGAFGAVPGDSVQGLQQLKGHLDNIIDGWGQDPPPSEGQDVSAMKYSQSLPALQQQPRPSAAPVDEFAGGDFRY